MPCHIANLTYFQTVPFCSASSKDRYLLLYQRACPLTQILSTCPCPSFCKQIQFLNLAHATDQVTMASVEPKPYVSPNFPNPLGLKLELREQSPAEIQIFDIFLAYLPVDSQVSASDAAAQINQVLLRNTGNADLGDSKDAVTIKGFLWVFWDMYWLIGCQIDPALNSDAIDRQVALFGALKQLPSPVRIENGSRVWQDLPVMGMSITERWNRKWLSLVPERTAILTEADLGRNRG